MSDVRALKNSIEETRAFFVGELHRATEDRRCLSSFNRSDSNSAIAVRGLLTAATIAADLGLRHDELRALLDLAIDVAIKDAAPPRVSFRHVADGKPCTLCGRKERHIHWSDARARGECARSECNCPTRKEPTLPLSEWFEWPDVDGPRAYRFGGEYSAHDIVTFDYGTQHDLYRVSAIPNGQWWIRDPAKGLGFVEMGAAGDLANAKRQVDEYIRTTGLYELPRSNAR